jgi:Ion channel/Pentapeptide repeats (9 copies)
MTWKSMAESRTASTLFIDPGDRVDAQHRDVRRLATAPRDDLRRRWTSDRGREVLRRLSEAGFKRDVLESSVGRLYENYDLRGISLQGRDLSNTDLHNVDFFAANLRDTKFVGCNLTNSHFSEADIRAADFSFARMNDAFLDNAVYDLRTTFTGVDIRHVNFNLAALLQDQARTQQRIAHLKSRNPAFAFVLHWTCNYGQSLGLWALWVLGTILVFAGIYAAFPALVSGRGFIDAIYFSVTTFSTLGLGDVTPISDIGKLIVMLEVVLGYLMGGLLIAILVRRLIGN